MASQFDEAKNTTQEIFWHYCAFQASLSVVMPSGEALDSVALFQKPGNVSGRCSVVDASTYPCHAVVVFMESSNLHEILHPKNTLNIGGWTLEGTGPSKFQLLAGGSPYTYKEGRSTWPVGGFLKIKQTVSVLHLICSPRTWKHASFDIIPAMPHTTPATRPFLFIFCAIFIQIAWSLHAGITVLLLSKRCP